MFFSCCLPRSEKPLRIMLKEREHIGKRTRAVSIETRHSSSCVFPSAAVVAVAFAAAVRIIIMLSSNKHKAHQRAAVPSHLHHQSHAYRTYIFNTQTHSTCMWSHIPCRRFAALRTNERTNGRRATQEEATAPMPANQLASQTPSPSPSFAPHLFIPKHHAA